MRSSAFSLELEMEVQFSAIDVLLLERQGTLFIEGSNQIAPINVLQAFEINLAQIGFSLSAQLAQRLRTLSVDSIGILWKHVASALLNKIGGNQSHVPLFRNFPYDLPSDTQELWLRRVLIHFIQAHEQTCLFCHRCGTTHVLSPCRHVVCDSCFDGRNYSACPICGGKVDAESDFILPTGVRGSAQETVSLKLLHLCENKDQAAFALFASFCERKQAMSPADREALTVIVREYGARLFPQLPATIPVRENLAIVFGTLLKVCDAERVISVFSSYLNSATDILRTLAVLSDADPSLQGNLVYKTVPVEHVLTYKKYLAWQSNRQYWESQKVVPLGFVIRRFKVAKMPRSLRRALFALMERQPLDLLIEDMLRHRSYWVWLGEFLHPYEYQNRFPNVAKAFSFVRKKSVDGRIAPRFFGFYSRMENAIRQNKGGELTDILSERPGEFGRRLDLALRLSRNSEETVEIINKFSLCVHQLSTPLLLTLRALLPTRISAAKKRLFWPKGSVSKCVMESDLRPPLTDFAIRDSSMVIENELLNRFSVKPALPRIVIDRSLQNIVVPFNERATSRAAIQLPRGSTLPLPKQKFLRLFLHWCQPKSSPTRTDLDLSVGFYDHDWRSVGVCSYYHLQYVGKDGQRIAYSSGDFTSAPFPDGASEFVDIDLQAAKQNGISYAVVVLNNYSGQSFEELERAFSGLMYRDDVDGAHFDPKTVSLKFDLTGGNGVFLPMVVDLEEQRMHWLDMYSTGGFQFNNVASSNSAITTICPVTMDYFESGIRMSMFELALLHAAARGNQVWIRGDESILVQRHFEESNGDFLARLCRNDGSRQDDLPFVTEEPIWAALNVGDISLPKDSKCYALQARVSAINMTASDLLT